MEVQFKAHQLRPGDEGFEYDKQVDFPPAVQRNEWDNDDDAEWGQLPEREQQEALGSGSSHGPGDGAGWGGSSSLAGGGSSAATPGYYGVHAGASRWHGAVESLDPLAPSSAGGVGDEEQQQQQQERTASSRRASSATLPADNAVGSGIRNWYGADESLELESSSEAPPSSPGDDNDDGELPRSPASASEPSAAAAAGRTSASLQRATIEAAAAAHLARPAGAFKSPQADWPCKPSYSSVQAAGTESGLPFSPDADDAGMAALIGQASAVDEASSCQRPSAASAAAYPGDSSLAAAAGAQPAGAAAEWALYDSGDFGGSGSSEEDDEEEDDEEERGSVSAGPPAGFGAAGSKLSGGISSGGAAAAAAGDAPAWLFNPHTGSSSSGSGLGARQLPKLGPVGPLPAFGTPPGGASALKPMAHASGTTAAGLGASSGSLVAAGATAAGQQRSWMSGASSISGAAAATAGAAAATVAERVDEDFASSGDEEGAVAEVDSERMSDFSDGSIEWP
jgi:hypothetical protein